MSKKIRWSPEEDIKLIEQYVNSTCPIIIENRSPGSIKSRIATLIKNEKLTKIVKKKSKSWTTEEEELLKELQVQGFTAKEIADKLGRTKSSIDGKSRNKLSHTISNWSQEELDFIHTSIADTSYLEIATILDRTYESVKYACLKLGYSKSNTIQISDEELLDLVRKYHTSTSMDRDKLPEEPGSHIIIHRFGSWPEAAKLAGISIIKHNMYKDRNTVLYLVDFNDFKKIGITQQTIKERFYGYPEYHILDYKIFNTPTEAYDQEQQLLSKLADYKYSPKFFPGKTECFRGDFLTIESIINL